MAKVEIIKLGHAFHKGERGSKEGGAPSKDSLWGIAFVGGSLVTFGGRRNGKQRFKARKKTDLPALIDQFNNEKITGYPFGKNLDCRYSEVDPAKYNSVMENLEDTISKQYYAAVKAGSINKRATQKADDAPAAAKPAAKSTAKTSAPKAEAKAEAKAEPKAKRKPATSVPAGYGSDAVGA